MQLLFFIYSIGIGLRFYFYYLSVKSGDYSVVKPAGVEGFLPISALIGLKQLLLKGVYDNIHPAGLTILLATIFISILFKKGFCGYICPFGFVSEIVSKFSLSFKIPKYIHYPLLSLKYILLSFFIYILIIASDDFLQTPYNKVADAKMMLFFMPPSTTTIIVISVIIFLTLLIKNFWCKYLCPHGALLGLLSLFSPFKIKRNKVACVSCGKCSNVCPMDIDVKNKNTIYNVECMGCLTCINNKANDNCLTFGPYKIEPYIFAILIVVSFLLFFFIALLTGHWYSSVTNEEYGSYLEIIDTLNHY